MAKQTKKKQDEVLFDLIEAGHSTQSFLHKYQHYILYVAAGVVVLIGAFFAFKFLYLHPLQEEAMEELYRAELQFEQDSFARALEDPGAGYKGFIDIADDYSMTKAGNLANYYAGISYLNLGRFDAAIVYLNDYKPAGEFTPIMKYGALGDAYSELGETDKAIAAYKKAIASEDNEFLTPYYMKKLAMYYRSLVKTTEAESIFKELKDKYPTSTMAQDVEKYLPPVE